MRGQACPDPGPADFRKEALASGVQLNEPLEITVAKNGIVLVAQRFGEVVAYQPSTGQASSAGRLDVYSNTGTGTVGGLLGVAVSGMFPDLDPWVYAYYAPKSGFNGIADHGAGRLTYRLSRFRWVAGRLDIGSEQALLEVPSTWETHNAGSLKFGKDGDLYLSTGDNRNPHCSDQYAPLDERPGREWCDGQATTANTRDLRGKVLRIRPLSLPAGGKAYAIPPGNLRERHGSLWPTEAEASKVLPEIYTMGHRNPYRIFPDPVTGRLFIAEYGPAAAAASERGPAGADQIKVTDEAAFLGYPYFLKDNKPYCRWDYALGKCAAIPGQAGLAFDPAAPLNHSPNNTGVVRLPPARPAALWEHDGSEADPIPGLASCGFGAGPVYHFDPTLVSKVKFPPAFDGRWLFFASFSSGWQPKLATVPAGTGPIRAIADPPWGDLRFSPGLLDMEFGAGDGALYVLDYGGTMYNRNADAGLYRITYRGCLPVVSRRGPVSRPASQAPELQLSGMDVKIPIGAVRVEAYSPTGSRVWSAPVDAARDRRLQVPSALGTGLLRLRWTEDQGRQ